MSGGSTKLLVFYFTTSSVNITKDTFRKTEFPGHYVSHSEFGVQKIEKIKFEKHSVLDHSKRL